MELIQRDIFKSRRFFRRVVTAYANQLLAMGGLGFNSTLVNLELDIRQVTLDSFKNRVNSLSTPCDKYKYIRIIQTIRIVILGEKVTAKRLHSK